MEKTAEEIKEIIAKRHGKETWYDLFGTSVSVMNIAINEAMEEYRNQSLSPLTEEQIREWREEYLKLPNKKGYDIIHMMSAFQSHLLNPSQPVKEPQEGGGRMKSKHSNLAWIIGFIIIIALFFISCQKEEYYHYNNVPVTWKYDSTGVDTLIIDISPDAWQMLPGDSMYRPANHDMNTQYMQKYTIYAVYNHICVVKFTGTTMMHNVILTDKVISYD